MRNKPLLRVSHLTEALQNGVKIHYKRLFEAAQPGILILDGEQREMIAAHPAGFPCIAYPRGLK